MTYWTILGEKKRWKQVQKQIPRQWDRKPAQSPIQLRAKDTQPRIFFTSSISYLQVPSLSLLFSAEGSPLTSRALFIAPRAGAAVW